MCTFPTDPPSLSFFWPWQAPGHWLVSGVFFAIYAVIVAVNYHRLLARTVPSRQHELAVGSFFAGFALVLAGSVLGSGFVLSSWDALAAWERNQLTWANAHQCAHDLFATVSLVSSSYGTLENLSLEAILGGFFIAAVGSVQPSMQRAAAWLQRWWEVRNAPS